MKKSRLLFLFAFIMLFASFTFAQVYVDATNGNDVTGAGTAVSLSSSALFTGTCSSATAHGIAAHAGISMDVFGRTAQVCCCVCCIGVASGSNIPPEPTCGAETAHT